MTVDEVVTGALETNPGIDTVYWVACGGSLIDLYPAHQLVSEYGSKVVSGAYTAREFCLMEPARLTERQVELDDGGIEELDRALRLIAEHAGERPEISVTWFRPDDRKDGGAYLTWRGRLKKMDVYERKLVFTDGRSIPIDSIRSVECGLDEKNIPGDG